MKYCKPQLANCTGLPVLEDAEVEEAHRHTHDIQELGIRVMLHRIRHEKCPMMREHLKKAVEKEFAEKDRTDRLFREIWFSLRHNKDIVEEPEIKAEHWPCAKTSVDLYEEHCGVHASFGLRYVKAVTHLCTHHKFEEITHAVREVCRNPIEEEHTFLKHLDVHEMEILVLHKRMADTECPVARETYKDALDKEVASRDRFERTFIEVAHKVVGEKIEILEQAPEKPHESLYPCMKAAMEDFQETCWVPAAHGLKFTRAFSALCHHGFTFEKIHPAVHEVCGPHKAEA